MEGSGKFISIPSEVAGLITQEGRLMKGMILVTLEKGQTKISLSRVVTGDEMFARLLSSATVEDINKMPEILSNEEFTKSMAELMAVKNMEALGLSPKVQVIAEKKFDDGSMWSRLDLPFDATLETSDGGISLMQKLIIDETKGVDEKTEAEVRKDIQSACVLLGVTGDWKPAPMKVIAGKNYLIFVCENLKLLGAENGNQENGAGSENRETGSGDSEMRYGLGTTQKDTVRIQEFFGSDLADKGKIN